MARGQHSTIRATGPSVQFSGTSRNRSRWSRRADASISRRAGRSRRHRSGRGGDRTGADPRQDQAAQQHLLRRTCLRRLIPPLFMRRPRARRVVGVQGAVMVGIGRLERSAIWCAARIGLEMRQSLSFSLCSRARSRRRGGHQEATGVAAWRTRMRSSDAEGAARAAKRAMLVWVMKCRQTRRARGLAATSAHERVLRRHPWRAGHGPGAVRWYAPGARIPRQAAGRSTTPGQPGCWSTSR